MGKLFRTSLLSLSAVIAVAAIAENKSFVTIGTGGQTGVYYAVGQSVCKLVNRDTAKTGIKCNAPSTGGSIDNLNALAAGERQMGVIQSDTEYDFYNGKGHFEGKANKKLRVVFGIHPEIFTIAARDDSGIRTFSDLKGKRVNIGNPGSGTRVMFEVLLEAKGWTKDDFAVASELKPAEMASALCDNNLDAIAFTGGHPAGLFKEAATSCKSHLVSVDPELIEKVVAESPYYASATVPGGMYKGTPDDVHSVGVIATLVTSSDVPEAQVYAVTKAVFDNFERFKKLHPAFANLEPQHMIKDGISVPLADGAVKYYKEKGWLK